MKDGKVALLLLHVHCSGGRTAVGEPDRDYVQPRDDVIRSEDVAELVDHDAGANTSLSIAELAHDEHN